MCKVTKIIEKSRIFQTAFRALNAEELQTLVGGGGIIKFLDYIAYLSRRYKIETWADYEQANMLQVEERYHNVHGYFGRIQIEINQYIKYFD